MDPLGLAAAFPFAGGGGGPGGFRSPRDEFLEGAGLGAHTALTTLSFGLTDKIGWTGDSHLRFAGQDFTRAASGVSRDLLIAAGTAGAGGAAIAPTAGATRELTMTAVHAAGRGYLAAQSARAMADGAEMAQNGHPIAGSLVFALGGLGLKGSLGDDLARLGASGRRAGTGGGAGPRAGSNALPVCADDDLVDVYRGVGRRHPMFQEATRGEAVPFGGHTDPVRHNQGDTLSEFTSWSLNPRTAERFARENGPGGVVLHLRIRRSQLHSTPDVFGEAEVLIKGEVHGATWSIVQ